MELHHQAQDAECTVLLDIIKSQHGSTHIQIGSFLFTPYLYLDINSEVQHVDVMEMWIDDGSNVQFGNNDNRCVWSMHQLYMKWDNANIINVSESKLD